MNNKKKKSVVLISGGMDSLLITALAHQRGDQLAALHINYGQRTQEKERECFQLIANFYHIPTELRKEVDLSFLGQLGGSSLTDRQLQVGSTVNDASLQDQIPMTYVPFRNTIMLSVATAWAELLGFDNLIIGAVEDDSPGYPDCRPSYYRAFNEVIRQGSRGGIAVETPIIDHNKIQIVEKCLQLAAPLEKSWSCYQREDVACGVCDSCQLRLRAFAQLGVDDPILYG